MFLNERRPVDPDLNPYTVDVGSGMMKVGFSGDDAPRAVFPTIVGRPKNPGIMVGLDAKDRFVGDEAQAKRGILKLNFPIPKEYGTDIHFNDLEKIFHHSWYNELCTTPEEHPLFITSLNPPGKDRLNLVKLTRMMFETFDMPAIYISDASSCALYASGRITGTVLDIGHGKTLAQSIYEGIPIEYSRIELEDQTFNNNNNDKMSRKRVSGDLITDVLSKLLQENHKLEVNESLATGNCILEIVRDIKEKLCFISPDRISTLSIDEEMKKKFEEKSINRSNVGRKKYNKNTKGHFTQEYELPDGVYIDIEHERYLAPEILFRPKLIGYSNLPGIHKLVQLSIEKCNNDLKHDLYQNIILSGGSTMFEGIVERLDMEIRDSLGENSNKYRVKISAPRERKWSSWIGGSIMSYLSTMDKMWVVKDDYDEYGPTIIRRMCPCTTRKNNQMGFFNFKCVDLDEDERREYILFQCFVGSTKVLSEEDVHEEEKSFEFLIKLLNQSMEVRFKTLLL